MTAFQQLRRTTSPVRLLAIVTLLAVALLGSAPRLFAAPPTQTSLEFTGGNGGIADSGFTTTLPGTSGANTSHLSRVTTGVGTLTIQSTAGDLPPNGSAQENALAISYDSQGSYTIGARLLAPLHFNSSYQSAGIFVGKDANNYIRFSVGVGSKRSNAQRLQLDVVDRGKLRSSTINLPVGTFSSIKQSIDLFLNIEHGGSGKLTALYRIDSDDPNSGNLATSRNFPRWLRGGNNTVYSGIATTSRGTPSAIAYDFDWFRLTNSPQITPSVSGVKTVDKDGLTSVVSPGDILTYTINVKNNGTATSVQVSDPIPADTTYVANSVTGGALFDGIANRITYQNGSLGTNQTASFTFQVKINQPPLQSSTIQNNATLSYGTSAFPALLNASTVVAGVPDLSSTTYVATPAAVGLNGDITYVLNIQNDGPSAAANATARLLIPEGTTYLQSSAQASSGILTIDPALTAINWAADSPLAVDSTVTISFTARVTGSFLNNEPIISQATVSADGVLPSAETAQSLFVDTTSVSGVSGSKTVDKTDANIGDTLTYTISIVNSGAPAANLEVVDPMPLDVSYVLGSLTTPSVGTASYDSTTRRVLWQIPSLGASETVTLSMKAMINPLLHSSVIVNKAVLTNPAVAVPETLLAASTVVRNVADLSESTYTATPTLVGANGSITYTLNLVSSGTAAATDATANLTIPNLAGVTLAPGSARASSGSIVLSNNQFDWTADGPLPIGAVVQISFRLNIVGTPTNGTQITSSATVQAAGTLPNTLLAYSTYSSAVQGPQHAIYAPVVMR
jgi:uncharacterized repeat protein (TIGR01451 family)